MTNVIDFPSRLTAQQLAEAKTQLSQMLQAISRTMLEHRDALLRGQDANALARAVRATADDLAVASDKWAAFAAVADKWLYG